MRKRSDRKLPKGRTKRQTGAETRRSVEEGRNKRRNQTKDTNIQRPMPAAKNDLLSLSRAASEMPWNCVINLPEGFKEKHCPWKWKESYIQDFGYQQLREIKS